MKQIHFLILTCALILAACAGTGTSPSTDNDALAQVPPDYTGRTNPLGPDSASEGAGIFKSNCSMCHGTEGHGDGPAGEALDPRPKNLAELQNEVNDDYLFWRISEGKPGTSMVAWKGILKEEQIWSVVTFLHTLK